MPKIEGAERDRYILQHILEYCDDIASTHAEFGHSKERFLTTRTYQNAVGMCILQIGELVKQLSPEFVSAHASIDWRSAARARDTYAHHYGRIDFDIAWETATVIIDELAAFCNFFLHTDFPKAR